MNGYLFAGYSVIVVLLCGYLVYLHARLGRLAREVEALREELEPAPPPPAPEE